MDEQWIFSRVKLSMVLFMVFSSLFCRNPRLCWGLNGEGLALLRFREGIEEDPFGALSGWDDRDLDPCYWLGVECFNGKVVTLNLSDLCLSGRLSPEIRKLPYLKSLILRNNSFYGNVPSEIGELKDLELLDLGCNNFSGEFPSEFANNLSLTTLLLDNNEFLGYLSPELYELKILSEFQMIESQLTNAGCRASCRSGFFFCSQPGDIAHHRQLQLVNAPSPFRAASEGSLQASKSVSSSLSPLSQSSKSSSSESPTSVLISPSNSPVSSPSASPLESPLSAPVASTSSIFLSPSPSPAVVTAPASVAPANGMFAASPPQSHVDPIPSPASTPSKVAKSSNSRHQLFLIMAVALGSTLLILISVIGIICFRSNKVVTVKPWATGLSGQLQKAFVTGVPKLKRAELESACEDFSNIIGRSSDGTIYKGTLSSGVEIAVTSATVKSRAYWSKNLGAQFRLKIDTLSRMNHKNFVNLIGYCEENEPFTRMMVFEYAPNGTLFEHLHIQEAEHLDWGMRLRIAMGMAYCLEYMHQLTPPITHRNLQSSSVYLTEDYAAKISDFSFWNDKAVAKTGSNMELLESPTADPARNVYSFGVILFEIITGRIPYSVDNGSHADWASDYLKMEQPLQEIVDPTLKFYEEDALDRLLKVIKDCVHPDTNERPTMIEIASKLKEITAVGPDGAIPKLSPLWWAELEILSTDSS